MKPGLRLIVGILACLVIAGGAYLWAMAMNEAVFHFRSPLRASPPLPGERLGDPATRRVVLVLVDGLRVDTAGDAQVMPVLALLRAGGASATMHSQTPSFSEPGYSTLLTGAWPYLNDGPAMNLDYADIPTWTQDNLFSSAGRAGLKTAISGYYWFEKLVPQEAVSARFYTPLDDEKADRAVIAAALPWLADPQAYQLILVHLDQVDYAGHHEGGPANPAWNAAAGRSDALLGEIVSRLDLAQDTVVVFSDHGHIDRGGHGGYEPVVLEEPLVLAGAGVKPGQYPDMQMVDLAPTVSALLGLNLPASAQGSPQVNMLNLPEGTLSNVKTAWPVQQDHLASAYMGAIGQVLPGGEQNGAFLTQSDLEAARSARMADERWGRAVVALAVALVSLGLVIRLGGKRAGSFFAGALVYLAVYNLRYTLVDHLTYSFSSVASQMSLILYNAATCAVALVAAWLVYALAGRNIPRSPGDAARSMVGLALVILWVLGLFALVHYALNGLVATWTLPEPVSFFLGLLALIQGLMVSATGVLMAGALALLVRLLPRKADRQAL